MAKKLTLKESTALLAKLEEEMSRLRKKMTAVRLQIKMLLAKTTARQILRVAKNGATKPN